MNKDRPFLVAQLHAKRGCTVEDSAKAANDDEIGPVLHEGLDGFRVIRS